ncbi:MAG TPA: hypothetical protein VGC24_02410 [Burkholderiaceae bacterium]
MHMLLVMVGGIVLLGVFLLFGWLWGASAAGLALAAKVFMPVWLGVAVANLWVGVSHAGYSVRDELPILLVVFIVPALVAGVALWQISRVGTP